MGRLYLLAITCVVIAVTGLIAAGCGGSSGDGGAAASNDSPFLDYTTQDSVGFVSFSTDFESDDWTSLKDFAGRFPGYDKALAEIKDKMKPVDFSTDIKPWLGDSGAAIVYPNNKFVIGVQSTDDTKARAALRENAKKTTTLSYKGNTITRSVGASGSVYMLKDGVLLVGQDVDAIKEAIDAQAGSEHLNDNETFTDLTGRLDGSLAQVYVNGSKLGDLMKQYSTPVTGTAQNKFSSGWSASAGVARHEGTSTDGTMKAVPVTTSVNPIADTTSDAGLIGTGTQMADCISKLSSGSDNAKGVAYSVGSSEDGLSFEGYSSSDGTLSLGDPATPDLFNSMPDTTIAALSVQDLGPAVKTALDKVESCGGIKEGLAALEKQAGFSIDDLEGALDGETALGMLGGSGIPSVGLAFNSSDSDAAKAVLDGTMKTVAALGGGTVSTRDVDGVTAQEASVTVTSLLGAQFDDTTVLTNSEAFLRSIKDPGDTIESANDYTDVRKAAGDVPDKVSGLLYLDTQGLVRFLSNLRQGDKIGDQLKPVGSILGWTSADGNVSSANLFLQYADS